MESSYSRLVWISSQRASPFARMQIRRRSSCRLYLVKLWGKYYWGTSVCIGLWSCASGVLFLPIKVHILVFML